MNFEDIKEQLKERFEELKGQVEASPAFNTLKERFENLSPTIQKTIIWASIGLFTLFLFSCPLSYWSTSEDNVARYDETRTMIRDLLRTSHLASQLSGGPEQIPMDALNSMIQGKLAEAHLLPEQMGGVQPIDIQTLGTPLAPGDILQEAVQVTLKKLNLSQVVELGYQMQEIHGTVKLAGMDVTATAENDHYFDVLFKLVKFALPEPEVAAPEPSNGKKTGRTNRRGAEPAPEETPEE